MATVQASITLSRSRLSQQFSDTIKRTVDVVISAAVLILLAPLFGLIAWGIKRESPGPAFFRGLRMGRGGKPFKILKFRTMYERPESYKGPKVTAQDDPRVTRLGYWLRETKLNELPQFWNVLKGEMSLVGPRPEDPSIAKTWPRDIWEEVLLVRPGITSPASVQYRNEESLLSAGSVMQKYLKELAPDKMRLDQLYVRYRSLWLDIDILLWTALLLLPRLKAVALPEQLLFVGPVTRLNRRYINWFTIDLFVTFVSIGFTGLVWRSFGPLDVGWPMAVGMAIGFALLFSMSGAIFGVNRVNWSKAADSDVYDLFPPWLLATVLAVFINLIMDHFPTELVLAASFLALLGFIVVRYHVRLITGFLSRVMPYQAGIQAARERVLVIGSGPTAQLANWIFAHPVNANRFWVVGFIDNDLFKQGMRIFGVEVLGSCKEISKLIEKHDIGVIVLADHQFAFKDFQTTLDQCKSMPVRLVSLPDIFGTLTQAIADSGTGEHTGLDEKDGLTNPNCLHCLARIASLEMKNQPENNVKPVESSRSQWVQSPHI
jgi:lipopolysaccharide/colanic/teichoic acid biosynthesis glycosyltransferase